MKRIIATALLSAGLVFSLPAFSQTQTQTQARSSEADVQKALEWLTAVMSQQSGKVKVRNARIMADNERDKVNASEWIVVILRNRSVLMDGSMIACDIDGGCAHIVGIKAGNSLDDIADFALLAQPMGRSDFCAQLACTSFPKLEWKGWVTCPSGDVLSCSLPKAVERYNS